MSPFAQAFFLVCNLDTMTVSLSEIRWLVRAPIQTIIQEVEARGFSVIR